MTDTTCSSCLYGVFSGAGAPQGLCKRYPPEVVALPGMQIGSAAFPVVAGGDWCGEHLAASATKETDDPAYDNTLVARSDASH